MAKNFDHIVRDVPGGHGKSYSFEALNDPRVKKLPYSIRVLLEATLRTCDGFEVVEHDVETVLDWPNASREQREIAFKPARVLLQDFTGVPSCVDLAAMRDAIKELGGDVEAINPLIPTDLVIDHSVQVDFSRSADALVKNQKMEFERNAERFQFLKWAAQSFRNMLIVPPGSGIVHQVNLEYLARVVFEKEGVLYPDSVVGTDSHTPMVNGLGVVGWGVGGIEAEAVMLGQPISLVLPEVIGFQLKGKMPELCTATDLVLTVTKMLRDRGVVGKFVEFYGDGCSTLSLPNRATIANMSPEFGATIGFFPVDQGTLDFLLQTNRPSELVDRVREYLKAQSLFREYTEADKLIEYTDTMELDLGTLVPSLSGPKRPQDRIDVSKMPKDFTDCLKHKPGFKGFGVPDARLNIIVPFTYKGVEYKITHGSVVIAAITSCTNTSNPSVMLGAALVARNAVAKGLSVQPYIKTSLSPGSGVVEYYLKNSQLLPSLEALGFYLAGFGCQTCIGNSGDLDPEVADSVTKEDLVVCSVLSGNRNFEGRVHPLTKANYLASPMLVVAYALVGTVLHDFETQPLGNGKDGKPVFLRDIWPAPEEIARIEKEYVTPQLFKQVYDGITNSGSDSWKQLVVSGTKQFEWGESTYIHNPPFFQNMGKTPTPVSDIADAAVLLNLGDSITTDHISPAGNIAKNSPAARYLMSKGIQPAQFNTYGSRRGHDEIMMRGTFANIRIVNKLADGQIGPVTQVQTTGEVLPVSDAAEIYAKAGIPLIVLAGKEYGSGSSRDWAAKGPSLLGVRAIIAQSFERIHRSNLVGMGILPLEFVNGENADSLGLTGKERFTIMMNGGDLPVAGTVIVKYAAAGSSGGEFKTKCRIDTPVELAYFKNGGILKYVLRKLIN